MELTDNFKSQINIFHAVFIPKHIETNMQTCSDKWMENLVTSDVDISGEGLIGRGTYLNFGLEGRSIRMGQLREGS